MNASGLVLVIAGAWVLCQVLGGNALGRLNVTGQASNQSLGQALGDAAGKAARGGADAIGGSGGAG